MIATFVVTLLIAMRLCPETIRGARFIRSLLARTLLLSGVATFFFMAAGAIRRWRGHPVDFTRAALAGAATGMAFHLVFLLSAAACFDVPLARRIQDIERHAGIVTFHLPGREPISVRPVDDGWTRVGTASQVPALARSLLCAAEDERCTDRLVSVDLEAYARAALAALRQVLAGRPGNLPGASDISAQTAMMLLDQKPHGRGSDAFLTKLRKTFAGSRLDDLVSRDDQVRLYLSQAPFGTVHGHEVIGLDAAAQVFYGDSPEKLAPVQIAELMARLRNPQLYYPYPHLHESPKRFAARLDRLRDRTYAILGVASRMGWISHADCAQARAGFLSGLTSTDRLDTQALLPSAPSLIRAVLDRVPDAAARYLEVWSAADPRLQEVLASAAFAALKQLRPRIPYARHPDDEVVVDAIVLDPDGGVAAQFGLPTVSGGMASHLKPEIYGVWLTLGPSRSMKSVVAGAGMTAEQGLYRSNNDVARAVARQSGLDHVVDHLRTQGYHVIGTFEPIVLGAGVTGSPWLVAGNLQKFGYAHPGDRVTPSAVSRITDQNTGTVLFEPEISSVFAPAVAEQVRSAMERVSLDGTGRRALHSLAVIAPIAAKTGTAGFYRRGTWQGEGGSWCLAIDRATGLTTVVRMRWSSGRPFELEGGQSAAIVVAKFVTSSRVISTGAPQ
jgi:membrane peptidoglycan carboxypeptidase